MSLGRGLAIAALAVYGTTATLGIGLATGAWRNERHRWIHHVGFIGAVALTSATVVVGMRDDPGRALRAAPALLPLAALPRISTRSRTHPIVALAAAPWLVAAAARAERPHR